LDWDLIELAGGGLFRRAGSAYRVAKARTPTAASGTKSRWEAIQLTSASLGSSTATLAVGKLSPEDRKVFVLDGWVLCGSVLNGSAARTDQNRIGIGVQAYGLPSNPFCSCVAKWA